MSVFSAFLGGLGDSALGLLIAEAQRARRDGHAQPCTRRPDPRSTCTRVDSTGALLPIGAIWGRIGDIF